jgi:hypothetical protein
MMDKRWGLFGGYHYSRYTENDVEALINDVENGAYDSHFIFDELS